MDEVNYCANGQMPAEHNISGSTNPCDLTSVQGKTEEAMRMVRRREGGEGEKEGGEEGREEERKEG